MAGFRNEAFPVGGGVLAGSSLSDADHFESKKTFHALSILEGRHAAGNFTFYFEDRCDLCYGTLACDPEFA